MSPMYSPPLLQSHWPGFAFSYGSSLRVGPVALSSSCERNLVSPGHRHGELSADWHVSGELAADLCFEALKAVIRLNFFYNSVVHTTLTFISPKKIVGAITCLGPDVLAELHAVLSLLDMPIC